MNHPRFDRRLAFYAQSHQNPSNEAIHLIAIPAIMLSLMGLLYAAHPWALYALIIVSMAYYLFLGHWRYTLAMLLWAALSIALLYLMGAWRLQICIAVFVIAWLGQFIGHKLEGRKPSFLEDVQYLLVGPLFVLQVLARRLRPKSAAF
jgi:uncharacterized membrane protein YGL010W